MALSADANGNLTGQFVIPPNIRAGTKLVEFFGNGGSYGNATFVGQGTLVTNNIQQTTIVTDWYRRYDPLAQTFTPDKAMMVSAVDLKVTKVGNTPILVQLRECDNGVPTQSVLGSVQLKPSAVTTSGWTRFTFPVPIALNANQEYAIVVICNDADSSLAIAQLGQWDSTAGRWITSQPYRVGVLLSSSNASTWTASQDKDLAFRLVSASFSSSMQEIDLGVVSVTGATDLMVLSAALPASAKASVEFLLTLPDGTQIVTNDGNLISLAAPITGNVGMKCRLHADSGLSAVIYPGTTLAVGTIAQSATYVTRAIPAGQNCRLTVVYEAKIPAGASIACEFQADSGAWTAMSNPSVTPSTYEGFSSFQFVATGINAQTVRVRLTLNGGAGSRPVIKDLRCMTV